MKTIYARVSTDKQTKSVSQQLDQCRELAQRGYTVVVNTVTMVYPATR